MLSTDNENYQSCPLALQRPSPTIVIRTVQLSDVDLFHDDLWQDRTVDSITAFIGRVLKFAEQGRGTGIVVIDPTTSSDTIIAYGQVTQWVKCAEISDLLVHPAYRGQGIGTAMIQFLAQQSLTMKTNCVELGVAMSNERALALYRRLGFKDSYTLQLDLGQGTEPVLYLVIDLTPFSDSI